MSEPNNWGCLLPYYDFIYEDWTLDMRKAFIVFYSIPEEFPEKFNDDDGYRHTRCTNAVYFYIRNHYPKEQQSIFNNRQTFLEELFKNFERGEELRKVMEPLI